ncbi:hypothetical protein XSR1_360024 [Xenorhabdus szentirmaii DSM 16338]|uniref:Uncharacterized protein n=1 Tax=Xenorhabdus szentirmaii DSM 16338 TaxID=1427518 RepID=W1J1I7_9GAMM|nr:hypothetical protein XSR1_360024 [Xenorhabdus szentirmaii DSM 16338]
MCQGKTPSPPNCCSDEKKALDLPLSTLVTLIFLFPIQQSHHLLNFPEKFIISKKIAGKLYLFSGKMYVIALFSIGLLSR